MSIPSHPLIKQIRDRIARDEKLLVSIEESTSNDKLQLVFYMERDIRELRRRLLMLEEQRG